MSNTPAPNVIWLFGDQHRAQTLGYRGDPNVHTPNIDRMAAEGVRFDNAVGGCPLCCPYRGSLISGRYPHNAVPGHERQLDPKLPTVATVFKEAGYSTAYFGKWHLDGFEQQPGRRAAMHIIPPERRGGFDTWCGYENNNSQYDCWVHGGEGEEAFHEKLAGYETDRLTDRFTEDLEGRAGNGPFFSVLSVQPPHDPYVAPAEWMAKHHAAGCQLRPNVPEIPSLTQQVRMDLAGYHAMIENWDWNVGRVLEKLDELRIRENTYVVFFSDHGDMHGSHGHFKKTVPWEESIRVPFIVSGGVPFYETKRGKQEAPVNHVDVAPTSLGLCGIDVPDWMEGTDYSALVQPKESAVNYPDSAYLQLVEPTRHGHPDRPWRGIVTKDGWKYVVLEGQPWMLFNLNEDPYEQMNLALTRSHAPKRRELQEELFQWMEKTGDSFQLPRLD